MFSGYAQQIRMISYKRNLPRLRRNRGLEIGVWEWRGGMCVATPDWAISAVQEMAQIRCESSEMVFGMANSPFRKRNDGVHALESHRWTRGIGTHRKAFFKALLATRDCVRTRGILAQH